MFAIDRLLALQKKTDINRWSNVSALEPAWDARAQLAARWIAPGAKVLDLGCGRMALRRFLPAQCVYRGCDLVARNADTVVCDFNAGDFPEADAAGVDVITILGVLEYIIDLDAFFGHLQRSGRDVVLSYSPREWSRRVDRAALGWLNDLSLTDLASLFDRFGFALEQWECVDDLQVLMKLRSGAAAMNALLLAGLVRPPKARRGVGRLFARRVHAQD